LRASAIWAKKRLGDRSQGRLKMKRFKTLTLVALLEVQREKMTENGIDIILSKPFNFDQINQTISKALQRAGKS
jgi:DNA-binding response OmpR family regulator